MLRRTRVIGPVCAIVLLGLAQLLVFRAFPAGGAFAYPWLDLVGITGFAVCGAVLARGDARARPLVGVFLAYLALGWAAKVYPPRSAGTRRGCSTTSRCRCWRSWPRSAGSVPVC